MKAFSIAPSVNGYLSNTLRAGISIVLVCMAVTFFVVYMIKRPFLRAPLRKGKGG